MLHSLPTSDRRLAFFYWALPWLGAFSLSLVASLLWFNLQFYSFGLIVILMVTAVAVRNSRRPQKARRSIVEAPLAQATMDRVKSLVRRGQRIEAMKLYRTTFGGNTQDAYSAINRVDTAKRASR